MAAGRIVIPGWQPAVDADGVPIPNARMYFYLNNTTTLATVYADAALTTPLSNPLSANSSGQWVPVWADDANLFSVSVDANYGPPGVPFTFDDVSPSSSSGGGGGADKLDRDGSNPLPGFLRNVGARAMVDYPIISDLVADPSDIVPGFDWAPYLANTTVEAMTIPPGDYAVKTNCTVQRPVRFAPGSRITIDAGITVTFSGLGRIDSDVRKQIVYGAGAILGLPYVDVTWFAGDKMYYLSANQMIIDKIPSADLGPAADADIQKAYNSMRLNGSIQLQDGCLTRDGISLIDLPRNGAVKGNKQSSIFIWNGTANNGFKLSYQQSSMSGFWMRRANLNVPAASGIAIDVAGGSARVDDFFLNGCFIGINELNQSGGVFDNFTIHNAREAGVVITDTNDPIIQNFFIVADDEFLTLTTLAGGFAPVAGNTLTGSTSGCKMRFKRSSDGYYIVTRFYADAAKPIVGETITSSSGGTAVIGSYIQQHRLGGVRVIQTAAAGIGIPMTEAVMISAGDIIGGKHNLVVDGVGTNRRQGPSYNRVTDVFLDSALDEAVLMSETDGWTFTGGCIQSRSVGLDAATTRNTRFIGTDVRDCSSTGVRLRPGCVMDFTSCTIADNRYGVAGNVGAHVVIENDPFTRVTFNGGTISRSTADGIVTDYGISLIGSGGQMFLWGVRFGPPGVALRVGAVQNLTTLTVYSVDGCTGLLLKNKGAFTISSGSASSSSIAHGIHLPLVPEDFRLTTSYPGGLGGLNAAVEQANITTTNFTTTLSNDSAVSTAAPRNLSVNWEIDVSYKV